MAYIEDSEAITGYRVKHITRPAFHVVGFTRIIPPGQNQLVGEFWDELAIDGRLKQLRQASSVRPWTLGLSSWDPKCEKKGFRHTMCIEETPQTDFSQLEQSYQLFRKEIGASDWLCFEMTESQFIQRFWQDNPYKMMKLLGFKFHTGDFNTGLHFDAYPPDFRPNQNAPMEFWITVEPAGE